MKEKGKLRCSKCKGKEIEIKAWIDANTHEFIESTTEDNDTWCSDCIEIVEFEEDLEVK